MSRKAKDTKSVNESIAKLESQLSVAKIENNAQLILTLTKIIKCLKSRAKA